MRWLWLAGAVILGVAAFAVYRAFNDPAFVAGLATVAAGAAWKAVAPKIVKPENDKVREARQKCERSGGVWDHARQKCKNR